MSLLQPLIDAHAILATEQQHHLAGVVGDGAFAVDLRAGQARFGPGLTYRCELVGSEAPGPGTWMWSWANPAPLGAHVTATARALRELGRERGIEALTEGEPPLSADVRGSRLVAIAVGHAGAPASYAAPLAGGGHAHLLLDGPGLDLPEADVTRLTALLREVLKTGDVEDWPGALGSFAVQRGLRLTRRDETITLAAPGQDGRVRVRFDDVGRVAAITAVPGRTPAPAPGSSSAGVASAEGATRRGLFEGLRRAENPFQKSRP